MNVNLNTMFGFSSGSVPYIAKRTDDGHCRIYKQGTTRCVQINTIQEVVDAIKIKHWKVEEKISKRGEGMRGDNFEKGDLVRVRSLESLQEEFGVRLKGIQYDWNPQMNVLCGKTFLIKEDVDNNFNHRMRNWSISLDMIEIVEKNYVEKQKEKLKQCEIKSIVDKKEQVISEMIEKVDLLKMKKIIAGSLRKRMTSINGVEKLLREWAEAKYHIYKMFGNKFKIEQEIEDKIDREHMSELLESLKNEYPKYFRCIGDFNTSAYLENKIGEVPDCYTQYFDFAKEGMKLSKFFAKAFNDKEFDIALSKVLEVVNVKGNVVVSIDPIDYLLMSKNRSGWTSCHSPLKDNGSIGEYCAGVFSYMCDESTLIAYKHTKKVHTYSFNSFKIEEYSKNWRQCMYFDKESKAFIASRQYPSENDVASKAARELFEKSIADYFEFENSWKVISDTHKIREHVVDVDTTQSTLHYNDALKYGGVKYRLCYNRGIEPHGIMIKVGSAPTCPVCGENRLDYPARISCGQCEH